MKESTKKYANEAYEIICHAANVIGSRLPGSKGEKAYAKYMGEKLREIGIEPKEEEFGVATRSGIGGLPYAGWFGFIISLLAYVALSIQTLWFGMALASVVVLVWLVFSCFFYKTWFDIFFKHEISRNVYGELLPKDGQYDYTIYLSGHMDTSWTWKHSEKTYDNREKPIFGLIEVYAKVGFGAVCVFLMMAISVAMSVIILGINAQAAWAISLVQSQSFAFFSKALYVIPAITAVGSLFVANWNDPREEFASRGAMDNASGCALAYEVIKYYKENPDKMPERCRIVDLNCGSEEAGLRGSMAFAEQHKSDDMLKNAWNINIDSIADEEYFQVVIKDDWQNTRFDTDLEKMFKDTFKEMDIKSKTGGCIHNPVGGCDSTPMTKAGIKSVTFAAQNPVLTYYYHTWRDVPERFSADTVGTGFDVITSVIDKIAAFQKENGYNGPQKKAKK